MGKIIEFSKDHKKNDYKKSPYSKIIKELENRKDKEYSFTEITNYANRILDASREFNPYRCQTLIVKITKEFGIDVYQEDMVTKLGFIKVDGDTKEQYKYSDKVIVVSEKQSEYLKRFVLAYLLGCYLFKYLGSDVCRNKEYFCTKYKYKDAMKEKIAYRFAMDILMPRKLFIVQYKIAVKVDASAYFVWRYLSKYFEVPESLVEKRIKEIAYS